MAARDVLLQSIRNNPKDVSFSDACKAAELLGFGFRRQKGSHCMYARGGEPSQLNFQKNRNGKIPTYQARQLIQMMDKYEDG